MPLVGQAQMIVSGTRSGAVAGAEPIAALLQKVPALIHIAAVRAPARCVINLYHHHEK